MRRMDYRRMAATAKRLLARFGQPVTIAHTAMDGSVTTSTALGVVAGTVTHTLGDSGISIGDDHLFLEASAAPEPGDRITYNGVSRVIANPVVTRNLAGTKLLVEVYARAG